MVKFGYSYLWVKMAIIQRKYTKKVIVSDALATAEARAERLRRARNMANLGRQEICDSEQLNINTYKGWEIARYGGLPIDGAEKVVKRIAQEGVICSADWLLYGKGQAPYVLPKEFLLSSHKKHKENKAKDIIIKEIMVFQSYYPDAIYMEIEDDGLLPDYQPSDFVAGIRQYGDKIMTILNKNCIIRTKAGEIIARYIRATEHKNKFMLICTNPNTKIKTPVIYDAEIEFAALITRHYKAIEN